MKKILCCIFSCLLAITTNAQIKVAGDDYSSSLTGSKSYYDRDVNFDKMFRHITPREYHGAMMQYPSKIDSKYSMLGDTVYICRTLSSKNILSTSSTIPQGYYEITGYIFCKENADSILASFGLKHDYIDGSNYDNSKSYYYNKSTIKNLKQDMLKNNFDGLSEYLMYIVLTQIEPNGNEPLKVFLNAFRLPKYYTYDNRDGEQYEHPRCEDSYYGWHNFIYLRYYNEVKNQFLGKEVYLVHDPGFFEQHRMLVDKCRENTGYKCDDAIAFDNIKEEKLKLLDKKYFVKDVILHKGQVCCVLQGEQSGSFAVYTPIIMYAFTTQNIHGFPEAFGSWIDWEYRWISESITFPSYDVPYLLTTQRFPEFDKGFKIVRVSDWSKMKQREQQKQKAKKRQENAEKQAAKNTLIAKYGSQFGELVAKRQVAIGMSNEMCRDAWGRPMNTYRTTTKYGQCEVWCYNYKTKVYFYNGKVVQIDN